MNNQEIKPVKLLLVEDNPGDVELTLMAFEESGIVMDIEVVDDGQKAIEYIFKQGEYSEASTPDLILLDLNLPRVSGLDILEKVKLDERYRTVPIIMLTTSNTDRDIFKAYNSHVNAYLNKPVDFMSFIDVINTINQFWFTLAKRPS